MCSENDDGQPASDGPEASSELVRALESIEKALALVQRITMIDLHWWHEEVGRCGVVDEGYPYHGAHWHLEDLGGQHYRLAHLAKLLKEIGDEYGVDSEGVLASDPACPARLLRLLVEPHGTDGGVQPVGAGDLKLGLNSETVDSRAAALSLRLAHREGRLIPPSSVTYAVEVSGFNDPEIDRAFRLLTHEGRTVGGSIPVAEIGHEWFAQLEELGLVEIDYEGMRGFSQKGVRMLTLMSEYASRSNQHPTEWDMSAWQPHPVYELLASL